MPKFEYQTNKGTFEIESNRELTSQELEGAINNLSSTKSFIPKKSFFPMETTKELFKTTTETLPMAGQVIGGLAGGIITKRPYLGSAIGGTLGRGVGEMGKIRYQKEPLTVLKDILSITMPGIGQAIPEKTLIPKETSKIAKEMGKAGTAEAIAAPLGYGLTKATSFLGRGVVKGLLGRRVAERGFEKGWTKLLNPEYYKNRIPKEIAVKTDALFRKASKVAGGNIDDLIRTKYKNTTIALIDIKNQIRNLLPENIAISDFAKSKAEEKLLQQATQDILSMGGKSRRLSTLWETRKNIDKLMNAHSWGDDAYSYLNRLRSALNNPIKSAGDDIGQAFSKYGFVKNAEYDLGKKLTTIKGVEGETYSPDLESFVSNLLSTNKDETMRMLKDIDDIVKADDKIVDKLLDYAGAEALEKGLGFGIWQDVITGLIGGRRAIAQVGKLIQSFPVQAGKKFIGRLIPTTVSK